jgi:hypothetical protein
MASTYVNDLRLNEMATGDQSGSWGTVTNTNLELIGEAFSYGTETITTNADTHATTIADGESDAGRAMFLKYTGTLDSTCTITIGPNTVSKMWFIENATTGSQDIIISQGSGANVTIAAGQTKAVYSDGVGSGAAFVDAFAALDVGSLAIAGTLVTATAAELNYNDITTLGTVQASKTVTADASGDVLFPDGDKAIFGAGSDLQIYHDGSHSFISDQGTGNLKILASTIDLNNAANTENMITAVEDGAVTLYHDNASKLATSATGVTVTGTVAATAYTGDGSALTGIAGIPTGVIAIWSGAANAIPSGWLICDGTNATPDLRDRFVIGAGSTYAVDATGGATTTASVAAHTHTLSGNTDASGNHTHTGTTSNTGNHSHKCVGTSSIAVVT